MSPIPLARLDAAVELLGRGGRIGLLSVQGDSMTPTLRSGQRVAVDFAPVELERGDLVLFRQLDYLVVHRLLGPATREDGAPRLRTRGDGLIALDPPLDRERVRGRVVAIEHDGAWRDLDGTGAKLYAVLVAVHDLAWAAAGIAAAGIDRRLGRASGEGWVRALVARWDHRLLRVAHGALFPACHRRTRSVPGERSVPAAILPR